MGFDLHIVLTLLIDQTTGLPKHYGECVPEQYRKFLHQRGPWFINYVCQFEGSSVSASRFLEEYPNWQDIENDCEEWLEGDHDEFRKALIWFSDKSFDIQWSC